MRATPQLQSAFSNCETMHNAVGLTYGIINRSYMPSSMLTALERRSSEGLRERADAAHARLRVRAAMLTRYRDRARKYFGPLREDCACA